MKIPKDSKKVFEGILFDVHHWEQEMFDGSHQTFEMLYRKPSVDVIAIVDDKILVLDQEQPGKPLFPSLPGGRVEKDEDVFKSAERELLEETGYKAEEIIKIEEFGDGDYSKLVFPETIFVGRNCKKITKQNLDAGEKIKIKFFDFDEFLQLCRDPRFTVPIGFKFVMYEALLDENKYQELKNNIYG